jgi:hypothetical protein
MSLRVFGKRRRLGLAVSGFCFVAASVFGGVEEIKTSVRNVPTTSLEPLRRVNIAKGTNELQLVAPQELGIDTTSPGKVTFAARELTYWISVRIIASSDGANTETSKPEILANYSGARVTQELSMPAANGERKIINFAWPIPGASERVGSVCFVHTAVGTVEITMVADSLRAKVAADDFRAVLNSLQTNEQGPIENIPMPDHS